MRCSLYLLLWVGVALGSINLSILSPVQQLLINNSVVLYPFNSQDNALYVANETENNLIFSWSSSVPNVSYSIEFQAIQDNDSILILNISEQGVLPLAPTTQIFNLSIICESFEQIVYAFIIALTPPNNVTTILTGFWEKDCIQRGCNCSDHGTCDEKEQFCSCDEDWFTARCNVGFGLYEAPPYCVTDAIEFWFNIPDEINTISDWIGLFPYGDPFTPNTLIDYTYLQGALAYPPAPIPIANLTWIFYNPGSYNFGLLSHDLYIVLAMVQITILPWESCLSISGTCQSYCDKSNGACVNSSCVCDAGFFWYDCSRGCAGTIVYTAAKANFSDGSGPSSYLPSGISCGWLIAPNVSYTDIYITFTFFELSVYDSVSIFSGNSTLGQLVASYAGSSTVPTIHINNTRSIFISFTPSSFGGQGFNVEYYTETVENVPIQDVYTAYNSATAIVFFVLAGLLTAANLGLIVFVIINRSHWIVKMSSSLFCTLINVGAIIAYAGVIPFFGKPTPINCVFRFWLPSVAFIIIYGNLFVKNFRLYRIFQGAKKLKRMLMTDWYLLRLLLVGLAYEATFCLIWTFVDTPTITLQTDQVLANTEYYVCTWQIIVFPILSLFGKAAIILFGVFLSFQTRKLSKYFSEAQYIGAAIYSLLLTAAIAVPLLYVLYSFQEIWVVIACGALLLIPTTTIGLIYIRILKFYVRFPNEQPKDDGSSKPSVYLRRNVSSTISNDSTTTTN